MSTPITVYGDVDARAVSQLRRCADAGEALRGALCADGHVGYSQPIGGAVAYADYISPSGVGYDIACLAAGTPVTTADGYFKPIESIAAGDPVLGWDTTQLRTVTPCEGAVARGERPLRRVTLALGRELRVTDDHLIRTRLGWTRADALRPGDTVACTPFVGLPYEASDVPAALLRVLAAYAADGHLGRDGETIRWHVHDSEDVPSLAADLETLGYEGRWYRRGFVCHSAELSERLVDFEWVFDLPAWQRGVFLSALMSARSHLAVPRLGPGAAIELSFVERLFASLGFEAGLRRDRDGELSAWKVDFPRYLREIGFNRSTGARQCAAAYLNSQAWEPAIRARAAAHARDSRVDRRVKPDHSGEVAWLPVLASEPSGETAPVYDVVTGDPAACFLADGVVVHNCGNKAARTNVRAEEIRADLSGIMDSVFSRISFGVGRKNDEPVDHAVLDAIKRADFAPQRQLYDLAAKQLGTVGSGNHYVDLFEDEDGWVWIGVHFGSRGFGHKTASGFLALAQGLKFDEHATEGEMDSPPVLLHTDSDLGQSYVAAMSLAGEYAYAGRDTVVDKVLEILGAESTYEVHNHHNFSWREHHFGTDVWVIRKGCTPAFPGQEGFVGATMGEPSVILRGNESEASADLLYSTVHGAGRVMSRTQAAGKMGTRAECSVRDCDFWVRWNQRETARCPDHPDATLLKRRGRIKPGKIDFAQVRGELTTAGIELRGGAADEAPGAYKRLDHVLAAHGDTIEIVHRLTPIGVAMAGADTFDPYKD